MMDESRPRKRFLRLTLRQWLLLIFIVPGIPFVLTSLLIVVYSTLPWPTGQMVVVQPVADTTEELIVLVHGKGDHPSSWAERFAVDLDAAVLTGNQQAVTVNWSDYSTDLFRSTLNARRIGHALGGRFAANAHLKKIHLVGHSAGSFVAYGICETVKEKRGDVFVQTTYLDPVGIYAGVDWGYGPRNFGSCADISDAYIDTGDGVPGSNAPLEHPHTFDVTGLRKKTSYNGLPHLWPIEFYRRNVLEGKLPYWNPGPEVMAAYPPKKSTLLK